LGREIDNGKRKGFVMGGDLAMASVKVLAK